MRTPSPHSEPARSPVAHVANPTRRLEELHWQANRFEDEPGRQRFLIACMADSYPPVRQAAARLLSRSPPDEASIASLLVILRGQGDDQARHVPSTSASSRLAALAALRGVQRDTLAALYARLSRHQDADVRYQALINLFELKPPAALRDEELIALLEERLGDEDVEVAVIAAQVASEFGLTALFATLDERRRRRSTRDKRLKLQFTLSAARLIALMDPQTRQRSVSAASQKELFEELAEGLSDETASSAIGAALADLALSTGEREPAVALLRKTLSRWFLHPILKVEAAAQLARLKDSEGLSYLSAAIDATRRHDARGHAIYVAGGLGLEPLYGQVARIAQEVEDYHNDTALLALANYATPASLEALEQLATTHPDESCRALILKALAYRGERPIDFMTLSEEDAP